MTNGSSLSGLPLLFVIGHLSLVIFDRKFAQHERCFELEEK